MAAIEKVRLGRPADCLKIIASIIPKEVNVRECSLEACPSHSIMPLIRTLLIHRLSVLH